MRLSNLLVGASLAGALLTACTTDEIAIPRSELYAREFIKKFGVIDPNRDLSAATHSGINVVTTSPTDVKVYADINGKRYLFAEGRKISGTTPIKFDVPASVKEVIVDAGGRKIKASLGSTVTVSNSSRTIVGEENEVNTSGSLTWSVSEEFTIQTSAVRKYINQYNEGSNNLNAGTNSFYFIADGKSHTFYPFYWNSNAYHCLGIYVLEDPATDRITMYDLYYTKSGELTRSNTNIHKVTINGVEHCYAPPKEAVYSSIGDVYLFKSTYDSMSGGSSEFPIYIDQNCSEFVPPFAWPNSWYTEIETEYGKPKTISYSKENAKYFTPNGYISKIEFDGQQLHFHETITKVYEISPAEEGFDHPDLWHFANKGEEGNNAAYSPGEGTFIRTKGITYKLATGTKYGFYIKVGHYGKNLAENSKYDYICFSHSERNKTYKDPNYVYQEGNIATYPVNSAPEDGNTYLQINNRISGNPWSKKEWWNDYEYTPDDAYAYASWGTAEMDGITYSLFGFEDCAYGYHDDPVDLNDVMFLFAAGEEPSNRIDEEHPEEPEPEVYQWMIAAEDLAGTYDWDFNDAVFAVSATTIVDGEDNNSTKTEITVEPLAAGGTLPIYVMFNGTITDGNGQDLGTGHFNIGPELHKWLGGYYRTPINVDSPVASAKGTPLTFTVNGQWSLTEEYKDKPEWAEKDVKGMGGLYVLVNPGNGLNYLQEAVKIFDPALLDDENHYHQVTPPTSFNKQEQVYISPEMLCMEAGWCWPMEEQGIHTVYHNFEQWLRGEINEWYTDPATWNPDRVVSRK